MLDAELELFQAQQDGSDSVESIQKRVNQLRIEAARSGILPTSRPPRGRRGFRGGIRGRGFYYPRGFRGRGARRGRGLYVMQGTSVDRRPTKVLVSGYETEEKDEVVEQFQVKLMIQDLNIVHSYLLYIFLQKYGEIVDMIEDDSTPSICFNYKNRREAEQAMANGKAFGDRILTLSW